ncbi:MAG TPA: helix-turn-helix domain-containing protein [Thermoanaerobaculia bacterium]|nr:helix-turn-helix domain-containing protein [Thermoanaerobaculia bacterium]
MKDELLEQKEEWEGAVARDERLRRLVPLEEDVAILTLSVAAKAAALEASSFSRYFHQVVGVPFRRWRAVLRVSRAIELLRETSWSVEDIAQEVGYGDARSLRRAMRHFSGCGPADIRGRAEPHGTGDPRG